MARKIALIITTNCPRCEYIRHTVYDKIAEKCKGQTFVVNGSYAHEFVKKYGIKHAPAILFLNGDRKEGLTYHEMDVDKIVKWLWDGRYHQ